VISAPSTQTSTKPKLMALRLGFTHLLQDESGQDLIEYALLAALIGLTAVTAVKGVGTKLASTFTSIGSSVTSAV
jgi:pilus assembly protein Flp/PilA